MKLYYEIRTLVHLAVFLFWLGAALMRPPELPNVYILDEFGHLAGIAIGIAIGIPVGRGLQKLYENSLRRDVTGKER